MPRPPSRLSRILSRLEIPDCGCKYVMLTACIAGKTPGCRERQKYGTCGCKPAWRRSCLLEQEHGCRLHRMGKPCECAYTYMPMCLSLGCDLRQKGKLCTCPRCPGEPCQHILQLADRLNLHTPEEHQQFLDWWIERLWQTYPRAYRDRRVAPRGIHTTNKTERVYLLITRSNLKRHLWHPQDTFGLADGEEGRRTEMQARGLVDLMRHIRRLDKKGGGRGA